jgi:hypothetical protein
MRKVIVTEFLSLDGVMENPAYFNYRQRHIGEDADGA